MSILLLISIAIDGDMESTVSFIVLGPNPSNHVALEKGYK